jgi:hypothetical protein
MSSDPFNFLDVSEDEATSDYEEIQKFGIKDRRICICGHSVKSHKIIEGRGVHKCQALKQSCPCRSPRAVLNTSNARLFLHKTFGGGGLHALTQGIVSAQKRGAEVEWVIEQKCDKCSAVGPVSPVPVTQQGAIRDEATGIDILLCRDCRVS